MLRGAILLSLCLLQGTESKNMLLFHPAQTAAIAWLCMCEGERDLACKGAVASCEAGLLLVSTVGTSLVCS